MENGERADILKIFVYVMEGGVVMKLKTTELTSEQRKIKDDLLKQLAQKGQDVSYLKDLVNDYVIMMQTRDSLQKDIKDRGTLVEYDNGGGQKGIKKNDSVEQFNKICDRMIKHLDFLGIRPSEIVMGDDDDAL